jgi:hypothetical protein
VLAQHVHEEDEHAGDLLIGSTARGGGALAIAFDSTAIVRVSLSESLGGLSLYTATDPGFDALGADEPGAALFALRPGTEVWVELVAVNDTALKLHGRSLSAAGDRILLGTQGATPPADPHHHPEFQLVVAAPPGRFGEGTVSFRLTTTSLRYGPSADHTLRLSNGHLASVEHATETYDVATLRCQKALARHVWLLMRAHARLLREWATDPATREQRAREAETRAVGRVMARCGPSGSGDYDEPQIGAHLGLVGARVEAAMTTPADPLRPECASVLARHAWLVMAARAAPLRGCLLRLQGLTAMEEAGRSRSGLRALIGTDCLGAGGEALVDGLVQARRRALAALRARCAPADVSSLRRLVAVAGCRADDIVSAVFPSAKADLGTLMAGDQPLSDHFPCLVGGSVAHEHTHAE